MSFPKNVWAQLKNKTCEELVSALEKDGWVHHITHGAQQVYRHADGRRITIHVHPGKTYGPNLLKALLEDIGWSTADMRKLKLIK